MSISNKLKKLTPVLSKPSIITGRSGYLFILSHMRSRSTVLSHVLGSHNEISGYSELRRPYLNRLDFFKMRLALYKDLKCDFDGKYLLDKILHDKHVINEKIFRSVKPKVIILLREPDSTIKSIMKMGKTSGVNWQSSPEGATEYYCSRLASLAYYGEVLKSDYYFLESENLVNRTESVLSELTSWLGLSENLEETYQLFSNSGKPLFGDPSDVIKSKKIVKTESDTDIEIPAESLEAVKIAYEKCKASLLKKENI